MTVQWKDCSPEPAYCPAYSEIALHHGRIDADSAPQSHSPHFRAVLGAQERLLNALEQLLEKLPGRTAG